MTDAEISEKLRDLVSPPPHCPSCGEDVVKYDGEEFCLSLECEEMIVDAEQPEPPSFVRDVLMPMWPAVAWVLVGTVVLPLFPGTGFFELEPHQQAYSLLWWPVVVFSFYRLYRHLEGAENVD